MFNAKYEVLLYDLTSSYFESDGPFEEEDKDKLREVRRREGRYLLRSNMPERPDGQLWESYLQLVQVEEAFKQLKSDLVLRPFHHQKQERIEAPPFFEIGAVEFQELCADFMAEKLEVSA